MGSKSNISNTSSMSRIHRNLFEIAKRGNKNITALNCNFLTLSELRVELKNASSEYVLLKNVHLADLDVIEFIKNICANLESKACFELTKFLYINIFLNYLQVLISQNINGVLLSQNRLILSYHIQFLAEVYKSRLMS